MNYSENKMVNDKIKIAFVARTVGLEYDDRIRKECITLKKNADIKLFVNFADNREEEGITSYGIPYKSFKLKTRDKLPSSKFLLIKAIDFYFSVKNELKLFDLVWAHEEYAFMFPLFSKKNKCIWDLHEIPYRFQRLGMRFIFNVIESKSKKLIHANEYRIKYLTNNKIIKLPVKHVFIRNLPDNIFIHSVEKDKKYPDFIKWLNGSNYAYLQGLAVPKRHPLNTIELIMQTPNLKAIVIGDFDLGSLQILKGKYGVKLDDKIYFKGKVDQLSIPFYLRNALFSIILYDIKTANNRYCEPNRLYQSIALGIPVLVGCNEPMKDLVDKYSYGVSMDTDGHNLNELHNALKKLLRDYQFYKNNTLEYGKAIIWDEKCINNEWYS